MQALGTTPRPGQLPPRGGEKGGAVTGPRHRDSKPKGPREKVLLTSSLPLGGRGGLHPGLTLELSSSPMSLNVPPLTPGNCCHLPMLLGWAGHLHFSRKEKTNACVNEKKVVFRQQKGNHLFGGRGASVFRMSVSKEGPRATLER